MATNAGMSLVVQSVEGILNTLEFKHLLSDPAWTPLSPTVPGTGSPLLLQDTNKVADSSRFYRVSCALGQN